MFFFVLLLLLLLLLPLMLLLLLLLPLLLLLLLLLPLLLRLLLLLLLALFILLLLLTLFIQILVFTCSDGDIWICKPSAMNQVQLLDDIAETAAVSQYYCHPLHHAHCNLITVLFLPWLAITLHFTFICHWHSFDEPGNVVPDTINLRLKHDHFVACYSGLGWCRAARPSQWGGWLSCLTFVAVFLVHTATKCDDRMCKHGEY